MTNLEHQEIINKCVQNICNNHNVSARLTFSEALSDRGMPMVNTVFIDAITTASFDRKEVERITGIKSSKDYRLLNNLVKSRIIYAMHNLKLLTETTLKNLGVK